MLQLHLVYEDPSFGINFPEEEDNFCRFDFPLDECGSSWSRHICVHDMENWFHGNFPPPLEKIPILQPPKKKKALKNLRKFRVILHLSIRKSDALNIDFTIAWKIISSILIFTSRKLATQMCPLKALLNLRSRMIDNLKSEPLKMHILIIYKNFSNSTPIKVAHNHKIDHLIQAW